MESNHIPYEANEFTNFQLSVMLWTPYLVNIRGTAFLLKELSRHPPLLVIKVCQHRSRPNKRMGMLEVREER